MLVMDGENRGYAKYRENRGSGRAREPGAGVEPRTPEGAPES